MLNYIIYVIFITTIIFIIKKSNFFESLKDNYNLILSLKRVILNKGFEEKKKEKLIIGLCSELFKKSTYQILVLFILMVIYLIMIFIKPEIEIIVFSFKGLIIAIVVSIILLKIFKNA